MELISTHVGADFDGFAAMMVARRFHPEARLFFPGSREGSLRRMIAARGLEISEIRQKEVDPAALTRVILCDIRQRDRIGVVASWLEANPGIEVWAYDHHPASPSDVEVTGGLIDPAAGSTSTLLVEELRRRGVAAHGRGGGPPAHGDLRGHGLPHLHDHRPPRSPRRRLAAGAGGRPRGRARLRLPAARPGAARRAPPHDPAPGGAPRPRPPGGDRRGGAGASTSRSWRRWSPAAWRCSSCRSSSPSSARGTA